MARVHLIPAEQVPSGPDAVMDGFGSQRGIAERLLDPRPAPPLALLVRVAMLNSPDQLSVRSASAGDGRLAIGVEVRTYTGPLFANIRSLAVVEVGPIALVPRPAEVEVTVDSLPFDTIGDPSAAGPPDREIRVVAFSEPLQSPP